MTTATLEAQSTDAAIQSFTVTFLIRRFDPDVDTEPRWQDFDVEMYATDRVLDALHKIKWEQDGSLTFRRSCAHGICGSDAMRINGRNRLACKTLIKDLDISKPIYVEAIKGLPLEKDLIVDMEPFFASFREVQPFLIANSTPEAGKERMQSVAERELLRRHHEVHPLRRVHLVVPGVLDRRPVLRPRRDRQRAPLHLRLARRRAQTCASTSSTTRRACGAAARPSTAPTRAPAASRSRRRSPRSSRRSCAASPDDADVVDAGAVRIARSPRSLV